MPQTIEGRRKKGDKDDSKKVTKGLLARSVDSSVRCPDSSSGSGGSKKTISASRSPPTARANLAIAAVNALESLQTQQQTDTGEAPKSSELTGDEASKSSELAKDGAPMFPGPIKGAAHTSSWLVIDTCEAHTFF